MKAGFQTGVGMRKKEDRLRDAAQIHLKLGELERYCEIMFELEEVGISSPLVL